MFTRPTILFYLLCLPLFYVAHGQSPKIKFGKIAKKELEDNIYADDTTASAVVLNDIGHFHSDRFYFTRHIRIKILKKSGTTYGNWVFNTPSKGSIKGYVYNLVNGEVTTEKLSNSSIHEEQLVDNFYVYKVFMPNVKTGSIIDIFYQHPGIPVEWRFQELIPIEYSELTIEKSQYVIFNKTQFGFEPVHEVSPNKWVAKKVPAFKIEPYISDYSNYISKFSIGVVSMGMPGRTYFYQEINTSWEHINKLLIEHPLFGDVIDQSGFLNKKAKEIADLNISTKEKIVLAHNYIKDNIKWNEDDYILASREYRAHFLKDHTGNSTEINLLLISLLNRIGINTLPVVLSTRSNGAILPFIPSIDKLNYVVGLVDHEGTRLFVDGTQEKLVPGILPEKCLNGQGLIVQKNKAEWVNLSSEHLYQKRQLIKIDIGDREQTATISQQLGQYAYLKWIAENDTEVENEKYLQKLKDNQPLISIEKYNIENHNPEQLIVDERMEIDLQNYVVDVGNALIFSPFIVSDFRQNPFKSEVRRCPIDLMYPTEYSSVIVIRHSPEYELKSIPESVRLATHDNGAEMKLMAGAMNSQIQLQLILRINKTIFSEVEYNDLRQFYSNVITKLNESIELIKKN